ncbi:MAG: hypothetical protein ACXU8S_12685 [Phenylobacterium sp.]
MRGLMAMAMLAVALPGALSGCATAPEPMSWFYSESRDEGAKLMLGVANSDDIRLMAICRPHSGQIRLTVFGRQGDAPILRLVSGKLQSRYPGAGVEDDGESLGGASLQFQVPADDPVLTRVADTGELALFLGERRVPMPNGFAQQHDFLRVCQR